MNSVFVKLAFRNLLRHRRRTLATGIAITAGLAGLVLLFGYISYVQKHLEANSVYGTYQGHVVIVKNESLLRYFSKPSKYILTGKDQEDITKILQPYRDDIEFISKEITGMGLISKDEISIPFSAQGISPETDQFVKRHPFYNKWKSKNPVNSPNRDFYKESLMDPSVVSVTQLMGTILVPGVSDLSGVEVQLAGRNFLGDLNAVNAKINASHSTGAVFMEETSLVATLAQLQNLFSTDGISRLSIFLKNPNRAATIKKQVQASIDTVKLPFEVYSYDEEALNAMFSGTMSFLFTLGFFCSVLILGAVLLAIVNSLTLGLLERMKEIGTFRAIGYDPRQINLIFVIESALQTLFFSTLGILLAVSISGIINRLNIQFTPPGAPSAVQFMVTPAWTICLGLFVLFLGSGIATSYLVLKRKTQFTIVQLLSDSGV